jgi:SAM-dependent methyltransferase
VFARFRDGTFYECGSCGLLHGPDVRPLTRDGLERGAVVTALQPLRERNFSRILDHLGRRHPAGARLLEVGSSTGVFLDLAARRGFDVHGVEPDPYFVDISTRRFPALADRVTTGYFPAQRPPGRFDVICFNDVFEHIPDAPAIMVQARELLAPGGCVSLSIPVSDGFFFRLAVAGFRAGFSYPLVRMLQLEFPFPHLYYFGLRSVRALAERLDMNVEHAAPLEILTGDSIVARFSMDQRNGRPPRGRIALARGVYRVHGLLPRAWVKPDLLHFVVARRA